MLFNILPKQITYEMQFKCKFTLKSNFITKSKLDVYGLTLKAPNPQNDQTHSNKLCVLQ